MKIKNIIGCSKFFTIQKIKVSVFIHYFIQYLKRELDIKSFILLIKRLLVFIRTLSDNKYFKTGNEVKLDLYVPFYGTKAFYSACDKFKTFDGKLPCTIALISITKACTFDCKHCYQREDIGKDVDISLLVNSVESLKKSGAAFFNIEGGDPFLKYDRLRAVCSQIGFDGEIYINSTGYGITTDYLLDLKSKSNVKSIMFSLHSPDPEEVNEFMGREYAWETMVEGIRVCHQTGIDVSINSCLQREDFYNGKFELVMEKARELGASLVQLIHPKAAGAWLKGGFTAFSSDDLDYIKKIVKKYNKSGKYKNYPSISSQVLEEDSEHYGCTAGGTDRVYINAKGDVQPCEFLNISFGNIKDEEFSSIFERMRGYFEKPGKNWLCEKYHASIEALHTEGEALPLNVEKSKKVYKNWDRGEATLMYKKIEEDLSF